MQKESALIVGCGAAGLACALFLAKWGKKVTILEKLPQAGKKLSISGGGHANFSNRNLSPDFYMPEQGCAFAARILESFDFHKSLKFVESLGLEVVEKAGGQFFLKEKAAKLTERLLQQCKERGVEIFYNQNVRHINWETREVFIETAKFKGKNIILAQGSPAGMRTAEKDILSLAASLGHEIVPFTPALTPLNFNEDYLLKDKLAALAGIGMPVKIGLVSGCLKKYLAGSLLFTHRGLSGPVILNTSLYWRQGDSLKIDFMPDRNFELLLDSFPRQTPLSSARRHLPDRLCRFLIPEETAHRKNGQLSRSERKNLSERIHKFSLKEVHKGGMKFAEVCRGGVSINEIDPNTMQSRLKKDVHIIGEMTEITGQLGGYNLHWAWASAYRAASAICGMTL